MSWTVSRSEEGRRMDVRMAAQLTWEGEAFFGLTTLIPQQSVGGTGRERKKSRRSCSRSRMKDREASSRLRLSQLSPSPQSSSLLSLSLSLPQKWHFLEEEEKEDERKSEEGGKQQLFLLLHPSTMSPFGRLSGSEPTQVSLPS